MDVHIIDRQPVPIVYLRYVGPYGRPLAAFWEKRAMPWLANRGLMGRAMYGIAHDDPDVTAPEQCRYDVGVEVADDFEAIGDECLMTVPGGRYATARFFGTPDQIHDSWQWMFRTWLPASGMQLDGRPTFEYYGPGMRFDATTGAFECDVTIPVVPL
jgi:AraC family transcriptional regulator